MQEPKSVDEVYVTIMQIILLSKQNLFVYNIVSQNYFNRKLIVVIIDIKENGILV